MPTCWSLTLPHRSASGLQHGQHELNHHALPPPSPRAGKRKGAALAEASEEDGAPASKRSKTSQIQAMDTEEPAAVQPGAADNLPAKAKRVPGKRGQAARKQKQEEQLPVQEEAEAVEAGAREQEGAEQEGKGPTSRAYAWSPVRQPTCQAAHASHT
jgi:hypothetical protein